MSRRIGQNGSVLQRNGGSWNPAKNSFGRYYVDTPEGRIRKKISLGPCATKTIARARLKQHMDREGVNDPLLFIQNTAPALKFREQAERWHAQLKVRRRRPVKLATVYAVRSILNAWLLPLLGNLPLRDVDNGAMKMVVAKMIEAGLANKTIVSYTLPIKQIVASAVTDKGEEIYPRKWNHDFVDLPVVDKTAQHRPTITAQQLEKVLPLFEERERVLVGLLAATGMRIGEPLALKPEDFSDDCCTLHVARSNWRGIEQQPKTPAAIREIDIPEVCATVIRSFIKGKTGYIFSTESGKPLGQRNALRSMHAVGLRGGFHMFRRFRTEVLRKNNCPRDLEDYWIGHACKDIGDFYALGTRKDIEWRKQWSEKIGVGFSWATLGHKILEMPSSNVA